MCDDNVIRMHVPLKTDRWVSQNGPSALTASRSRDRSCLDALGVPVVDNLALARGARSSARVALATALAVESNRAGAGAGGGAGSSGGGSSSGQA